MAVERGELADRIEKVDVEGLSIVDCRLSIGADEASPAASDGAVGSPGDSTRRATSSKRSGRRGAMARSGRGSSPFQASRTIRSSPSPVEAATRTGRPAAAAMSRDASAKGAGGGTSYLMLPVTRTRSPAAPSLAIRSASSRDCMAKAATPSRTPANHRRTRRYRRNERGEIRPLTRATGTPRARARSRSRGQISVSVRRIRPGRTAASARSTGPARSSGKEKTSIPSATRRRAASRPAAVVTDRPSRVPGSLRESSARRLRATPTSPTETA